MKKHLLKLKVCLLLMASIFFNSPFGYSQSSWARGFGSTGDDIIKAMTKGNDGSLYAIGTFTGTVDFDPGQTEFNLTSAGETDMFIVKYSASGDLLHAVRIGGITNDEATAIAVDKNGNCHITGFFQDQVDFNPDPVQNANIVANGDYDVFVLKLDSSLKYVWAKKISGPGFENGTTIAVDGYGYVVTGGIFSGETDFNPDVPEFKMTSEGLFDAFISKLDDKGNFVWAKQLKGTNLTNCNTVMIGHNSKILIGGSFDGTLDSDPHETGASLFTSKKLDGFVACLDSNGSYQLCFQISGPADESINAGTFNEFIGTFVGEFSGKTNFHSDLGVDEYTPVGKNDVFVLEVDFAQGFVTRVNVFGSPENDYGKAITNDQNGNLYIAGEFSGLCDFNTGAGDFSLSPTGGSDIFLSTMKSNGDFVNAQRFGGNTADYCNGIVINSNVFLAGGFSGSFTHKNDNLQSKGKTDAFILSEVHALSSVKKNKSNANISAYPNPSNGKLTIDFDNILNPQIEVYNSIGQKTEVAITIHKTSAEIQMPLTSGFYFVKISGNDETQTLKIFRK